MGWNFLCVRNLVGMLEGWSEIQQPFLSFDRESDLYLVRNSGQTVKGVGERGGGVVTSKPTVAT